MAKAMHGSRLVLLEVAVSLFVVLVMIWIVEYLLTRSYGEMMFSHLVLALIALVLMVSSGYSLSVYGLRFSRASLLEGAKIFVKALLIALALILLAYLLGLADFSKVTMSFVAIAMPMAFAVAFPEEMFFRGYLQTRIGVLLGRDGVRRALIAGIVFGVMHVVNYVNPPDGHLYAG